MSFVLNYLLFSTIEARRIYSFTEAGGRLGVTVSEFEVVAFM